MEYIPVAGFGLLLPGLVAFACLAGAALSDTRRPRSLLGAVIFAAIPLWCALLQLGPWRPAESWQWLPYLAILACLINVAAPNKWILWISYSLFALLAAWLLVPNVERLADERPYWLAAVPLAILITLDSTILLSRRLVGPALPFYLLLATLAAALLVFLASLAKFAQLGGILAGIAAGCCVACWLSPTRSLASAIVPGWATLYSGLLLEARLATFSEVPLLSYLLLLLAPLMICLTAVPPVRKMKAGWRTVLTAFAIMIPLAIGLYLAGNVAIEDMTEAELPEPLLSTLRHLFGKSLPMNMEE